MRIHPNSSLTTHPLFSYSPPNSNITTKQTLPASTEKRKNTPPPYELPEDKLLVALGAQGILDRDGKFTFSNAHEMFEQIPKSLDYGATIETLKGLLIETPSELPSLNQSLSSSVTKMLFTKMGVQLPGNQSVDFTPIELFSYLLKKSNQDENNLLNILAIEYISTGNFAITQDVATQLLAPEFISENPKILSNLQQNQTQLFRLQIPTSSEEAFTTYHHLINDFFLEKFLKQHEFEFPLQPNQKLSDNVIETVTNSSFGISRIPKILQPNYFSSFTINDSYSQSPVKIIISQNSGEVPLFNKTLYISLKPIIEKLQELSDQKEEHLEEALSELTSKGDFNPKFFANNAESFWKTHINRIHVPKPIDIKIEKQLQDLTNALILTDLWQTCISLLTRCRYINTPIYEGNKYRGWLDLVLETLIGNRPGSKDTEKQLLEASFEILTDSTKVHPPGIEEILTASSPEESWQALAIHYLKQPKDFDLSLAMFVQTCLTLQRHDHHEFIAPLWEGIQDHVEKLYLAKDKSTNLWTHIFEIMKDNNHAFDCVVALLEIHAFLSLCKKTPENSIIKTDLCMFGGAPVFKLTDGKYHLHLLADPVSSWKRFQEYSPEILSDENFQNINQLLQNSAPLNSADHQPSPCITWFAENFDMPTLINAIETLPFHNLTSCWAKLGLESLIACNDMSEKHISWKPVQAFVEKLSESPAELNKHQNLIRTALCMFLKNQKFPKEISLNQLSALASVKNVDPKNFQSDILKAYESWNSYQASTKYPHSNFDLELVEKIAAYRQDLAVKMVQKITHKRKTGASAHNFTDEDLVSSICKILRSTNGSEEHAKQLCFLLQDIIISSKHPSILDFMFQTLRQYPTLEKTILPEMMDLLLSFATDSSNTRGAGLLQTLLDTRIVAHEGGAPFSDFDHKITAILLKKIDLQNATSFPLLKILKFAICSNKQEETADIILSLMKNEAFEAQKQMLANILLELLEKCSENNPLLSYTILDKILKSPKAESALFEIPETTFKTLKPFFTSTQTNNLQLSRDFCRFALKLCSLPPQAAENYIQILPLVNVCLNPTPSPKSAFYKSLLKSKNELLDAAFLNWDNNKNLIDFFLERGKKADSIETRIQFFLNKFSTQKNKNDLLPLYKMLLQDCNILQIQSFGMDLLKIIPTDDLIFRSTFFDYCIPLITHETSLPENVYKIHAHWDNMCNLLDQLGNYNLEKLLEFIQKLETINTDDSKMYAFCLIDHIFLNHTTISPEAEKIIVSFLYNASCCKTLHALKHNLNDGAHILSIETRLSLWENALKKSKEFCEHSLTPASTNYLEALINPPDIFLTPPSTDEILTHLSHLCVCEDVFPTDILMKSIEYIQKIQPDITSQQLQIDLLKLIFKHPIKSQENFLYMINNGMILFDDLFEEKILSPYSEELSLLMFTLTQRSFPDEYFLQFEYEKCIKGQVNKLLKNGIIQKVPPLFSLIFNLPSESSVKDYLYTIKLQLKISKSAYKKIDEANSSDDKKTDIENSSKNQKTGLQHSYHLIQMIQNGFICGVFENNWELFLDITKLLMKIVSDYETQELNPIVNTLTYLSLVIPKEHQLKFIKILLNNTLHTINKTSSDQDNTTSPDPENHRNSLIKDFIENQFDKPKTTVSSETIDILIESFPILLRDYCMDWILAKKDKEKWMNLVVNIHNKIANLRGMNDLLLKFTQNILCFLNTYNGKIKDLDESQETIIYKLYIALTGFDCLYNASFSVFIPKTIESLKKLKMFNSSKFYISIMEQLSNYKINTSLNLNSLILALERIQVNFTDPLTPSIQLEFWKHLAFISSRDFADECFSATNKQERLQKVTELHTAIKKCLKWATGEVNISPYSIFNLLYDITPQEEEIHKDLIIGTATRGISTRRNAARGTSIHNTSTHGNSIQKILSPILELMNYFQIVQSSYQNSMKNEAQNLSFPCGYLHFKRLCKIITSASNRNIFKGHYASYLEMLQFLTDIAKKYDEKGHKNISAEMIDGIIELLDLKKPETLTKNELIFRETAMNTWGVFLTTAKAQDTAVVQDVEIAQVGH